MTNPTQFVKVIKASLLTFICLLAVLLFVNLIRLTALDRNLSARTDELGAINSNISANEQVTDYLKSDQYVEKEARENHGLVNEDDKVFSAE